MKLFLPWLRKAPQIKNCVDEKMKIGKVDDRRKTTN